MIGELTVVRMTSVRLPFSSPLSVLNLSPTGVLFDCRQGGRWTAPCSPAVPAFGEITSGQPGALVRSDACYAQVQSWRDSPLLPIALEVLDFL